MEPAGRNNGDRPIIGQILNQLQIPQNLGRNLLGKLIKKAA